VSPQDIPVVVKETILGGKVVAGLLRGGNNVVRAELQEDSKENVSQACLKKGRSLWEW
jgi:hypothetical protein